MITLTIIIAQDSNDTCDVHLTADGECTHGERLVADALIMRVHHALKDISNISKKIQKHSPGDN